MNFASNLVNLAKVRLHANLLSYVNGATAIGVRSPVYTARKKSALSRAWRLLLSGNDMTRGVPSPELLEPCSLSLFFSNETTVGWLFGTKENFVKKRSWGDGPKDGKLLLCWLCCCWRKRNGDVFGFILFWIVVNKRKRWSFFGRPSPTPNNERVRGVLYANPLSEMCATVQC